MKRAAVTGLCSLLLAGCAATTQQQSLSQAAAPIAPECVNADAGVQEACTDLFIQAPTQGPTSPVLIDKSSFPSADPDVIKRSPPGGRRYVEYLVRDEIILDPNVGQAIKQSGLPDAIEFTTNRAFVMYYRNPPHTFFFHQGQIVSLADVPRSVRILTFEEQPPKTPWPVTLTSATAEWLAVPKAPEAPPAQLESADFTSDVTYISSRFDLAAEHTAQGRAAAMLQRLAHGSQSEGANWRMVVFKSSAPHAVAVPNGTLFISDGLVKAASDPELAAVIAHLMGHVRYGHYHRVAPPASDHSSQPSIASAGPDLHSATVVVEAGLGPLLCLAALPLCLGLVDAAAWYQSHIRRLRLPLHRNRR